MGNGLTKGTLKAASFLIDVNPLVVESGIGKLVDALLCDMNGATVAQFLTFVLFEVFV